MAFNSITFPSTFFTISERNNINVNEVRSKTTSTNNFLLNNFNVFKPKLKTEIKPTEEFLKIPTLEKGDIIKAGDSKNFNIQLKGKPKELLIFGFQWLNKLFNTSEEIMDDTETFNLGRTQQKRNLAPSLATLYIDLITNEKIRFFTLKNEYSNNIKIENQELDSIEEVGVALGHPLNEKDNINQSFFANDGLKDISGQIVVKNVNINSNILQFVIENQSNSDIELTSSRTLHPVPITNNTSILPKGYNYSFVNCVNDKLLLAEDTFACKIERANGNEWYNYQNIFLTNQEATEFKIINNPYPAQILENQEPTVADLCYNTLLGNPADNNEHAYILSIGATPKYNNPNEFYCGIIHTANNNLLLFDSETNKWTAKDISLNIGYFINYDLRNDQTLDANNKFAFSGNDSATNIFKVNQIFGKKPLDIKDMSNGLHCLITTYRSNSFPVVYYSNDGSLNTFQSFGPHPSSANSSTPFNDNGQNLINPNHFFSSPGQGAFDLIRNIQTYSKIIDENTLFVNFCNYVNTIDPNINDPSYRGNKNFFLKTTNQGTNWDDILVDHYEYSMAQATERFISDNGQIICVLADFSVYDYPSTGSYFDNRNNLADYSDNTLLFNISEDGGDTWKFSPNNWSKVIDPNDNNNIYRSVSYYYNPNGNRGPANMFVHYDISNDIVFVGACVGSALNNSYGEGANGEYIVTKSKNKGTTWESIYPYPYLGTSNIEPIAFSGNINVMVNSALISNNIFKSAVQKRTFPTCYSDANDIFGSFMFYTQNSRYFTQPTDYQTLISNNIINYSTVNIANDVNYIVPLQYDIYGNTQLTDAGNWMEYYKDLSFNLNRTIKGHFTWETTDDNVINVFEPSKKLEKRRALTMADIYFNAFYNGAYSAYGSYGSYGSYGDSDNNYDFYKNFNIYDIKLFTTNGSFDALNNIHVKYTEFK